MLAKVFGGFTSNGQNYHIEMTNRWNNKPPPTSKNRNPAKWHWNHRTPHVPRSLSSGKIIPAAATPSLSSCLLNLLLRCPFWWASALPQVLSALRSGKPSDQCLEEVTGVRARDDEIATLKKETRLSSMGSQKGGRKQVQQTQQLHVYVV